MVRAGGSAGSQETWTMQMFNKSLSSSPAFLNFQAPETFKNRADNETSSLSAVDVRPFHPNYTLPLSPLTNATQVIRAEETHNGAFLHGSSGVKLLRC